MKNHVRSKKIINILLITVVLLFTTKVYAANDSFGTTLQSSSSQVKRDDNITITMGLKDIAIESGEKGIAAYTTGIEFDSSVFEYVTSSGTDKWEKPFYENGLITATTNDGKTVNTAQSIGTITLKVKENAKLGETNIKLSNFSGSTVTTDVPTAEKSVKVTILDNNSTNNGSNNNSSNNNSSTSGNKTNNTIGKKENIKSGVLPKTGKSNIMMIIAIEICILSAIIFLTRIILLNKRIKNDK